MSTLTQQMEQLKKQQADLEVRIKKEEETKKNLEDESCIERLEALVQPLTEVLDRKGNILYCDNYNINHISVQTKKIEKSKRELESKNNDYNRYLLQAERIKNGDMHKERILNERILNARRSGRDESEIDSKIILPKNIQDELDKLVILPPQKNKQLLEEEIYTTIISIFKKQQQEICYLHKLVEEQLNDGSENIKLNINDNQVIQNNYSSSYKDLENLLILVKESHAGKNKNGYLFITINPKPGEDFQKCHKIIQKIVKKTCFTDYLYVVEQRGTIEEGNIGKGFQFHILTKRALNYNPTKCEQNVRNSTKKICDSKNNLICNIQKIGIEFAQEKVDYITEKNKTGEGKDKKQEKQDADKIFRKNLSLSPFYGNIDICKTKK